MIHVDNHSVYESAKILHDKYVLQLDNGESVYIDFFSGDTDRNIYQVTHQVTMDKAHKDDVVYKNRYDVTVLINGLPLVQIELKRPGVEINEAINQINRYRKFSFKGIFRYLQLFVVSNSVQTKYFCNENEMMDGQYNPILKSLVFFWTDEKNTRINDLNTFTGEFFRKSTITEMMDKYMVIKTTEPVLMVMRPYQIYAVKAAKKRVLEVNQDGYVFACTGSGKTLTSFKLAQLLRDESMVDLVVFLIDRKDLDDQTVDEYNSFEKDCVDNTDSTAVLINMLKSSEKKMIVTTIQKMANAVKNPKYAAVMDAYKDKKVVFIIDECHRSQFGKMHSQIEKHFERANYIGFTGTPIFEKNKGADGRTTADIFHAGDKLDSCLHKYMIKDAIADGNVLRFSVEYQRTIFARNLAVKGIDPEQLDDPEYCKRHKIDMEPLYHDDERIAGIAKHIFEHHEQHVHPQGKDIYTALFAVDKIQTLGKYYDEFKKLNDTAPDDKKLKVAAIFSYQANEDMDDGTDEHSQELLDRCMQDYNDLYGTAFTLDTFDAYRKDIAEGRKPDISRPGTEFYIEGLHNIILLAAFLSFKTTDSSIRTKNHFTWGAIKEVAVLFIGIFITMQPALMLLKSVGPNLGISEPYQMFWATGALSSFLDNTPTYLVFLTTAGTLGLTGGITTALGQIPVNLLEAISCGAVFMGANTYIGNAPNFMVKSMSDENGVRMPSFFGYMVWSLTCLVPVFIIDMLVFFL